MTNYTNRSISMEYPWSPQWENTYYHVLSVIYGILCVIGLCGNSFNAIVLARCGLKCLFSKDRFAHVGFIFLAIADSAVCLMQFPRVFITDDANDFESKNFEMYYQLYGITMVHSVMLISTWITVLLAIGVCIVLVCDPYKRRAGNHVTGSKMFTACILTAVLSILFCLPNYWILKVSSVKLKIPSSNGNNYTVLYWLDTGSTGDKKSLLILTWVRFAFGYAIPFVILLVCNFSVAAKLIKSERNRPRLTEGRPTYRRHSYSKITPTLLSIIVAYLVFMTPSEMLDIIFDGLGQMKHKHYIYTVVKSFTNLLQLTNYAFNFALHIGLNKVYRLTLFTLIRGGACKTIAQAQRTTSVENRNTTLVPLQRLSSPHHSNHIEFREPNEGVLKDLYKLYIDPS